MPAPEESQAAHGQAVHDVQQTWGLGRGQALAAIRAAVSRHPGRPGAREWERLLQVAGRRLSPPDPIRYPTHASDIPDAIDRAVDTAVDADHHHRGGGSC
jgi:hypothetical protein